MPVVSFENSLDGCRNFPELCSAVSCWDCPRGCCWAVPALPSLRSRVHELPRAHCSAVGGSTESSAWLDKAGWGAEKAKDGFICTAGIIWAV